jgi:polyhydroxyalkanoate synthesis repressor PhaR
MLSIKRYPNRKLYNTEAKRYITLEEIATLIRQGQQVQVLDHATGEDLTALTLTQIIFEQEKKQHGFVPQAVLTALVKAGDDTLDVLQQAVLSSLDFVRSVDGEIERRVQTMISQGELAEAEGRRLIERLLASGRQWYWVRPPAERDLEGALARRGLPTHQDLQALSDQLDALATELGTFDPEA